DLHGDADLVADEHTAGLEGRLPGEAELLAGDLGAGGETDAFVAEGVGGRTVVLDREGGGLGHAVDGEVAEDGELLAAALDAGADEGPGRLVLGVPEVGGGQVVVAVLVAGVDGRGLDGDVDGGVGEALGDGDVAGELGELATD